MSVFQIFTHTRTQLILQKVSLEVESSGINSSVSGVQVGIQNIHSTITHLSVTGVLVSYVVLLVLRLQ